ncbi:MAG: hypothetical protein VYC34_03855 [Planctomycetota bacterium]|nr:hypothetical protein [Planctomycetota bacterium]
MNRLRLCVSAAAAFGLAGASAFALNPTLIEDFETAGDLGGWGGGGGNSYTNPGTGGVGGADDGFLMISREFSGSLATRNFNSDYEGDYVAAGITAISLWFNDLGTPEGHMMRLSIGTTFNLWQTNLALVPGEGEWVEYIIDLTDQSQFTQIGAFGGTLEDALMTADRILIRHDTEPFDPVGAMPTPTTGDVGIDRIMFIPAPGTGLVALLGAAGLCGRRRR